MLGRAAVFVAALAAALGPVVYYLKEQAAVESIVLWSGTWYGDTAVLQHGEVYIRGNTHMHILDAYAPNSMLLRVWRYSLLALLGEVYMPSVLKVADWDFRKEADPEGRFCRSLLDYFWVYPSHPMNRGNRQDMNDFVGYCREEYAKLSSEEKEILEPWHGSGRVPEHLLMPPERDPAQISEQSRRAGLPPYTAEKLTMQELEKMIRESMNKSTWRDVVTEIPDAVRQHYAQLDLRKVPQIPASWKEIRKAIEGGRLVGFDATKLFPEELFNMTPSELARREGPDATRMAVLADWCSAMSLQEWGWRMDQKVKNGSLPSFNLADGSAMWAAESPDITPEELRTVQAKWTIGAESYCDAGYIHTRRVPKFHASLPDVIAETGLQDDALRLQSYLWMGALKGGFHYDEEANIYVQLTGEADVWLVHQNYSAAYAGHVRTLSVPSPQKVAGDPFLKQIPQHVVRLRAGQGLVFPAHTYHLFCAQSPERIALNFFFMPKWRRMEYSEADWYTQEGKGPNGLVRLALRQIWMRSFARLWDEKKRALVVNAFKNEYL